MLEKELPKSMDFFIPVLKILKQWGGSATTSDIYKYVVTELNNESSYKEVSIKAQLKWTRIFLTQAGFLNKKEGDVWELSLKGQESKLSDINKNKIYNELFKPEQKQEPYKIDYGFFIAVLIVFTMISYIFYLFVEPLDMEWYWKVLVFIGVWIGFIIFEGGGGGSGSTGNPSSGIGSLMKTVSGIKRKF